MNYRNQHIGIWGLGITGKAAIEFFHSQGALLSIIDRKPYTTEQIDFLKKYNVTLYTQENLTLFLDSTTYIFPSPGVDIRPYYKQYEEKWIIELDIFQNQWRKPIIAITGTVGKTTVTSFLFDIMHAHDSAVKLGGNIGIPIFNLLPEQHDASLCLLETSDVQLTYTQQFAPDLAVWTNFSENHLDWHDSVQDYFKAKCKIIAQQQSHHYALVPLEIYDQIQQTIIIKSKMHFFTLQMPGIDVLNTLTTDQMLFCYDALYIHAYYNKQWKSICKRTDLPPVTYEINWLIIIATLHILNIPAEQIFPLITSLKLPAYRLEKIATIRNIDFYNDAKSTAPAATLAAVEKLSKRPIILFLGGLSKNIDRSTLIKELSHCSSLKAIYCFGAEAHQLAQFCMHNNIVAFAHEKLETALGSAFDHSIRGDQILFSPAGSSFDLFANYEERGKHFTHLVQLLQAEN